MASLFLREVGETDTRWLGRSRLVVGACSYVDPIACQVGLTIGDDSGIKTIKAISVNF
jgi:hypothetical protein